MADDDDVPDFRTALAHKHWAVEFITGQELQEHRRRLAEMVVGRRYTFAEPLASGAYSPRTGALKEGLEFQEACFLGKIHGDTPVFEGIPVNDQDSIRMGWKWFFAAELGPGGIMLEESGDTKPCEFTEASRPGRRPRGHLHLVH